ncbi:MAG: helix-turn-helix domain-containing protein [Paludibacter sp.]|nr:helix-turn-helix domain-containing protein [Paludibacter sp.]
MKQPDLGKRIAELRKAKGFTQDELVEKCNINVRTLQRIESGEVTPRSYTIKIIFSALECNMNDFSKNQSNKFTKAGFIVSKWLEQFYINVIDLFNFKTNKMKKLMILSVPLITICLVMLFLFSANVKAQTLIAIREKLEKTSSNLKFEQWFNSGQIDSISMRYLKNACMMPDQYPTINDRKNMNTLNNYMTEDCDLVKTNQLQNSFQIPLQLTEEFGL